jgi:YggT family protein
MNALTGATIFVIQTLISLYLTIVLLRFVLQLVKANFYNPLSQFTVKATQPLLKPIRRIVPSLMGMDTSSLLLAIVIQALLMAFVMMMTYGTILDFPHLLIWAILGIVSLLLKIFWVAIRSWRRSARSFRIWAAWIFRRSLPSWRFRYCSRT